MIKLGDPVPRFSARCVRGMPVDLHVDAGRWVVLAFFGPLDQPRAREEFAALLSQAAFFSDDRLVVYGIFSEPSGELERLAAGSGPAFTVVADYDGDLAQRFGAKGAPRTIVLDPMLRAIADIAWDHPGGHAQMVAGLLRDLPAVDDAAGVPLNAPVLIVPRVLDFALCDLLVALYDKLGGEESGFLLDTDGKTATIVDHRLKRRRDLVIAVPELRETIRERFVTRLLPEIARYFQFDVTRMDRYLVACYDSALGGHFFRHRDNINAGAAHRRFAVTINLNKDYDGCDLVFPEFGRRAYRAPVGGAVVFSCGALHEVTAIRRGRRFAFIPFLYGEDDAARRKANNARLHDGEAHYRGEDDRLYPLAAE